MSYYPEYDGGPFRTHMREFQPDPAYRASARKTLLARRQRNKRQRALFFAVLLGAFISWAVRNLHPSLPDPPPLLLEGETHAIPPRAIDTTSRMNPFWRDYRHLVTAVEDYDDWFADADAATRAIGTMWARVLAPDEEWHAHYQGLISARAKRLDLAHAHWREFLANRERVVMELVGSAGALWRVYVDGRPVDDAEAGELNKRWGAVLPLGPDTTDGMDIEFLAHKKAERKKREEEQEGGNGTSSLQDEEEQGFAALRFSARRITEELVRTHAKLFRDLDAAHAHVREAENADRELKDLVGQMTRGWFDKGFRTSQMTISVGQLKRRMEKLRAKRENMVIGLEWLQIQFPEDIESAPEKITDQTAWLESAKELLHEWAAALLDVQEGVLFLLRRRELPREHRLTAYYVAIWEAWLSRNCGGTSCYNAPGVMANVKNSVHWGKPVANVAQDEADWIKSLGGDGMPRVWRGVYDKACCQASILRDRIQHGSNQPSAGSR
ncbi:hypothetical protein F5B21DRAFT_506824 [Xylaria acuta]|nr:hypothetical protein F5B21DRAFT_506824 [Xylaria acuta]